MTGYSNDVEVMVMVIVIVVDVDNLQIEMFLSNVGLVMSNERVHLPIEYFDCFPLNLIENDNHHHSMNTMNMNYRHVKENNRWQLDHHWEQREILDYDLLTCCRPIWQEVSF